MQIKKAFTLIELAVVLLVILLLIAGIMQGGSLVQTSRILGARSFTAQSIVPKIDGLIAWYETSTKNSFKESEAYDGAQITTWYDISPSSIVAQRNSLTKSASSQVTYVEEGINSLPSIMFDGSSSASKISASSLYQGILLENTVFLVFNATGDLSSHVALLDGDASSGTKEIGIQSDAITISGGTTLSGSTTITAGTTYIVAAYFNNAASKIYLNDAATEVVSGNAGAGMDSAGLVIGSNRLATEFFTGMISEVIFYNHLLSLQERRDVFRYLADKYKVTVAGI